jgi:ABC-type branched-subunit amino acid transport system ATPase component
MLKLDNLHAFYGKSHVLHGVDMRGRRGRDRRACSGRNGSGRSTTVKTIMGLVDGRARSLREQEILGRKAFEIAHLGIGYVPENRDIFPKLTVHQNLLLGEKRGAEAALGLRRHVRDVPAPEGAPAHRGRRALGRRAADAHAVPHADGATPTSS